MRRIFLFLFLIAWVCSGAHASNRYMSTTGSNGNNGLTISTPWASMQYADGFLAAGDTLFIRGGTYDTTQYFETAASGSADHPIVVTAYQSEKPIFTGYNNPTSGGMNSEHLRFKVSHPYYVFNGLTSIRGWNLAWDDPSIEIMDIFGPNVASPGAHHITVTNCSFKGDPAATHLSYTNYIARIVLIYGGASYITMNQDSFLIAGEAQAGNPQIAGGTLYIINANHHIVLKNSYVGMGPHDVCVITNYQSTPNHHIIMRNNIFDGAGPNRASDFGGGYGVDIGNLYIPADTLVPMYCVIENNIFYPPWKATYRANAGFLLMGGNAITLRKNLFFEPGGRAISIQSNGDSYNSHYQANIHNFFYNNTIVNSGIGGLDIRAIKEVGVINPNTMFYDNLFANNIFYNSHQKQCWPGGLERCEDGESWLNRAYNITMQLKYCTPEVWTNYSEWGHNFFKNNLISQFNPTPQPYASAHTILTWSGGSYSENWARRYETGGAVLADSFPAVFTNCKFQVDPDFAILDSVTATLDTLSPCVDAGLKMNVIDTVVTHLLAHDETWARAAGLDTMIWYGTAPDIGWWEFPSGAPVPPKVPECTVSPTTLSYGTWTVNSTADWQTFTIKNTGDTLFTGTVSESCADFYIPSGSGAYSLAVGDSIIVTVVFMPLTGGAKSCTIETGNAACSDVTATGGGCTLTPSTIAFGDIKVGECSTVQTITLANSGTGIITGTISELSVDFNIISGGGSYLLNAGESRLIYIQFCPLSLGSKTCTINF